MPEQNFDVNSQLEYGFQLIDYNSRRNKVKSALENGKINEDRYNEYLMKFNDEERIQQTKIDNYKNAIEGYSDKDKIKYITLHGGLLPLPLFTTSIRVEFLKLILGV